MNEGALDAVCARRDEAAADAVLAEVRRDPSAAALLRDLLIVDALVAQELSPGRRGFLDRVRAELGDTAFPSRSAARVRKTRRHLRTALVVLIWLAVIGAVAAGTWWWRRVQPQPAAELRTPALIAGWTGPRTAEVGTVLHAGEQVLADPGALAAVALADGRLDLRGPARLELAPPGAAARLACGTAEATAGATPLRLLAPGGSITVQTGRCRIAIDPAGSTRVTALAGRTVIASDLFPERETVLDDGQSGALDFTAAHLP